MLAMSEAPIMVRVTRAFAQPPERVFDAFLSAPTARRFLFATERGVMVRAELVPLVGGVFIFTDRRDGVDVDHCGEYLEIERPHRLVFDFGVPAHSPKRGRVEIEIAAAGSGAALTLTQELAPEHAEYADRTRQGWTTILGNLGKVLAE
jgi:uncharacterized protein YndB with AHSA1/START domain